MLCLCAEPGWQNNFAHEWKNSLCARKPQTFILFVEHNEILKLMPLTHLRKSYDGGRELSTPLLGSVGWNPP